MTTDQYLRPGRAANPVPIEKLNDEQLDWLCREGRVETFEAGSDLYRG